MITVKNLTNSPIDMPTEDGRVWIPAHGEASGNFAGEHYDLMLLVNALEGVDGAASEHTPAAKAPDIDQLRADYLELIGKKPHHKLSAAKIQAAIDEALAK